MITEKKREYNKQYYAKNKKKIKKTASDYYKKNREEILRKYREAWQSTKTDRIYDKLDRLIEQWKKETIDRIGKEIK